jgi:hypothetical protein
MIGNYRNERLLLAERGPQISLKLTNLDVRFAPESGHWAKLAQKVR